jgi:hypothetical protein
LRFLCLVGYGKGGDPYVHQYITAALPDHIVANCFAIKTCSLVVWDVVGQVVPGTTRNIVWDGSFCAGGHAYASIRGDSSGQAELLAYVDQLREKGVPSQALAGVYCAVKICESADQITIAPDPLSQYPLFISRSTELTLISNCQYAMECGLRAAGCTVTKSITAAAHELLCGSGAWDLTGITEIRKLPFSAHLEITNGECHVKNWGPTIFRRQKTDDYRELMERAAENYGGNVAAICSLYKQDQLVFDLSGGRDSRLNVAAAFALTGRSFTVHVGGRGEDFRIGEAVRQALGLRRIERPSTVQDRAASPLDEIHQVTSRLRGTCVTHFGDPGRTAQRRIGHVRGACAGSILRTAYAIRLARSTSDILNGNPGDVCTMLARVMESPQALASALQARNLKHRFLFHREFVRENVQRMEAQLSSILDLGVPWENILDVHYCCDRGWRQNGMPTRYANQLRATFEPQNDPLLARAAMTAPLIHRFIGGFTADLMNVFTVSELGGIPYANHPYLGDKPLNGTPTHSREATKNTAMEISLRRTVTRAALDLAATLPYSDELWEFLKRRELIDWLDHSTSVADDEDFHFVRSLLASLIWRTSDTAPAPFELLEGDK